MSTSRQLNLLSQGGPFEVVTVPKPTPGPNEVLIAGKAIAMNPVDNKRHDIGLMITSYPAVLGIEGAGIIETVGSNVTSFRPGDEVMAMTGDTFREHWTVPTSLVAKKPASLSWKDAVSLPVGYLTAATAIVLGAGIPLPFITGEKSTGSVPRSVLVLGGSSVVGAATIQLLKMAYPDLLMLTTASPRNHEHVKTLGATEAFDQNADNLVKAIKAKSRAGEGVDVIVDAVGSAGMNPTVFDALSANGPKVHSEVFTSIPPNPPKDVKHTSIRATQIVDEVEGGSNAMPALQKLLKEGRYRLPTAVKVAGHGLEAVPKALDKLKAGVSGTKIVVTL